VTSSGSVLSSYTYTLNADGMRTVVTEQQKESDGSTSTTTKTWSYDNLMRLTGETVTSTISANSYIDTYSYDLVDNRLSKTDVVGNTTTVTNDSFNNNDQLTSETGTVNSVSSWSTSFQYDPNGSLTNVTRTGSGAETDAYVYDLQHRLNSATINRTEQGQSVAITASYVYDDSGYRAQGTVIINNGTPTITNYLTDTMNPTGYTQVLEEHTNGSSSPSTSYVIGEAVIAQANSAGVTIYLLPDGLGSTRLVADASGNVTTRFAYDAFGMVLGTSLGVLNVPVTRILFVGQQFDPGLLKYNLRARIYNPASGRFDTVDPLRGTRFYPITFHRYIYASADPVDRVDPSGRADWVLIGVLAGIAIALIIIALVYYRRLHHSSLDSAQKAIIDEAQKTARVRLDHAYELLDDNARWPQTQKYFQQANWKNFPDSKFILDHHEFYRDLLGKVREGLDTSPPNFLLANESEELLGEGEGGPAFVKEKDRNTIYIRKPFWKQSPSQQAGTMTHEYDRVYLWDDLPQDLPDNQLGTAQNFDNILFLLQQQYDKIIAQEP